jgi:hypothetical protein
LERKDFAGGPVDQAFDLTSSGRGEWTTDGSPRDMYMDPENETHQAWLRGWCRAHWLSTFKRSLVYGNKLVYHCCCNSFSRRSFSKAAGHPAIMSLNVLQIPGLRNAVNQDDLYHWLLDILVESTRHGQRVLFPSLNRTHIDRAEQEEETGCDKEEYGMLAKRSAELERELEKTAKMVQELKKDNERLLKSTNSWHQKYEQLLDTSQSITMLITPKKHRNLSIYDFPDD